MSNNIGACLDPGLNDGRYKGSEYDDPQQDRIIAGTLDRIHTPYEAETLIKIACNSAHTVTNQMTEGGATGTLAIATSMGDVTIGQLGDSTAYIVGRHKDTNEWQIQKVTRDHSAEALADRIRENGGIVMDMGRHGIRTITSDGSSAMAIGASFGDSQYEGLVREPEIFTPDLSTFSERDRFVMVASDGLEKLTEEEILSTFSDGVNRGYTPNQIANALTENTKTMVGYKGGMTSDNISVTISNISVQPTAPNKTSMIGVFDGHGNKGGMAAEAVKNAVTETAKSLGFKPVAYMERKVGERAASLQKATPPSPLPAVINTLPWELARKDGVRVIQLDLNPLNTLPDVTPRSLIDDLKQAGISAEVQPAANNRPQIMIGLNDDLQSIKTFSDITTGRAKQAADTVLESAKERKSLKQMISQPEASTPQKLDPFINNLPWESVNKGGIPFARAPVDAMQGLTDDVMEQLRDVGVDSQITASSTTGEKYVTVGLSSVEAFGNAADGAAKQAAENVLAHARTAEVTGVPIPVEPST